jgi:hypothetical protein
MTSLGHSSDVTLLCIGIGLAILLTNVSHVMGQNGVLFPRDSESRQTKSLDGIWNFRSEPKGAADVGLSQQWYSKPLSEVRLNICYRKQRPISR